VFAHQSLLLPLPLPPLTDRPRAELKKGLYALFSQFGSILEINVSSAFRLRGQAWIVFKDVPSATKAMRDLQGFMFFDKQMVRMHARTHVRTWWMWSHAPPRILFLSASNSPKTRRILSPRSKAATSTRMPVVRESANETKSSVRVDRSSHTHAHAAPPRAPAAEQEEAK